MTRKILFISLLSLVLSICTQVVCFANNESETTSLGNEITTSINNGMNNVRNATDDVLDGGRRVIRDGADGVSNMMDNMMNDNNNHHNNYDNNNYNKRDYNNGYNTIRTAEETNFVNNATMSTTTWMWIIFALAAIIIIAAIWYYAMQGNDRD